METPRTERRTGTLEEGQGMSTKLRTLPKPKNDFELVEPEDEEEAMEAGEVRRVETAVCC